MSPHWSWTSSQKAASAKTSLGYPWTGGADADNGRCCRWFGIHCDSAGAVVSIVLAGNGLEGSLPTSLAALTTLQRLDLHDNRLVGPLPDVGVLGRLGRLRRLNLANNSLDGHIPPEFDQLYHLTDLELNDNRLTGPIPAGLGRLEALRRLDLAGNRLNGPIPPSLALLANLKVLLLHDNRLEGTIPEDLGRLDKLTHLYLFNNHLHGVVPDSLAALADRPGGLQHVLVNGRLQPHRLSFAHHHRESEAAVPRHVRIADQAPIFYPDFFSPGWEDQGGGGRAASAQSESPLGRAAAALGRPAAEAGPGGVPDSESYLRVEAPAARAAPSAQDPDASGPGTAPAGPQAGRAQEEL